VALSPTRSRPRALLGVLGRMRGSRLGSVGVVVRSGSRVERELPAPNPPRRSVPDLLMDAARTPSAGRFRKGSGSRRPFRRQLLCRCVRLGDTDTPEPFL